MSKNIQNDYYYEICVINRNSNIIQEYVTPLPIVKGNGIVQDKLIKLMKEKHGDDIFVLFNKKDGNPPVDNRPIINIELPQEPTLNYNKQFYIFIYTFNFLNFIKIE